MKNITESVYDKSMNDKKRIMLTVAYDGTNYHGWQIQPTGITIEEVLNRTLSELLGERIAVIGASRTDAGVHAMGNVAVFDTVSRIPGDKMMYALNQRLPEDIRIQASGEVPADFHPRHCVSEKTYEYSIYNGTVPMPQYRFYSYFYYRSLDLDAMQKAADYFVGEHDFESFCSVKTQVNEFVRTIHSFQVVQEGQFIRLRIKGSGFLYNMVRILTGTLLEVGGGRRKPEDMMGILAAKDRSAAGVTAPACGLTLAGIRYPELKSEFSMKIKEKLVDTDC
ncbi:tRNA pseudouridine(38-40) synthase TruA [Anaerolentibacter hominis]|uniref:tRNA pseudouridine(38-40) synthase TruA n=1 Tax=Anaerolentibacter hominis TaxID=3079009 RepID=UPI0031B8281D